MGRYGWVAVVAVLLLTGAFGLRGPGECESEEGVDKAYCLHETAISYAALEDGGGAIGYCEQIRRVDINTAPGQADMCLMDVATLTRDPAACASIPPSDADSFLFGAEVTQELCRQKVENINRIQDYQCLLLYFLPLLLVTVIYHRR
ncbi:MAG TPA: hypothetical protein VJH24_04525 [Candidatus Bilamarchaeaceae archaeon]|nr:hypothetical protein [Candidatus Bilamarchaeaceae archaeon]